MSKNNLPAYEPLDDQLKLLKGDVSAPASLKSAVVNGTVEGARIPARVHVQKTAKAILLYVTCVALLLGAVMILPKWLDAQPPIGTQPSAPIDRDAIQNPEQYTDLELEALNTVWTAMKKKYPDTVTINDLVVSDIYKFGNALVCRYYAKHENIQMEKTIAGAGGYRFVYDSTVQYTVFIKTRHYDLANAVQNNRITQEDLATLAAAHEQKYLALYDRDTIDHPEQYTAQELAELKAAWAVIKPHCYEYATINEYVVWNFFQLRDIIVCQYKPKLAAPVATYWSFAVAGYTFTIDYNSELYVFANGNCYTVTDAYFHGVLSQEDVGIIRENHKANNPSLYVHQPPMVTEPYVRDPSDPSLGLGALLEGKTCVNDLVDQSTLSATAGFTPKDPQRNDIITLFDGYKTQEDMVAGAGTLLGKVYELTCFVFDMKESVKLSAYVIISGSDNHFRTDRNPVAWHLYATNDAEAAAAMRGEYANYEDHIYGNPKWVDLDYVWDGCMYAEDFYENGYAIDANKQGEYRYYCWLIEYTGGGEIEVAELELYID